MYFETYLISIPFNNEPRCQMREILVLYNLIKALMNKTCKQTCNNYIPDQIDADDDSFPFTDAEVRTV